VSWLQTRSVRWGEDEAVGGNTVGDKTVELAGWGEAVDFSGGIGDAGLALVGEVDVVF